jgi:hypothetical protein
MDHSLHLFKEWVGYYTYQGKTTKLPMHVTLEFSKGEIHGAGIDNLGQFIIDGFFDERTSHARWSKRYIGAATVEYEGTQSENEIGGSWSLVQTVDGKETTLRGDFHLWPLPAGLYGEDEPLQSVLEREVRRKGQ